MIGWYKFYYYIKLHSSKSQTWCVSQMGRQKSAKLLWLCSIHRYTSKIKYGLVAQIVEQETENLRVSGASPFQATIYWAIAKLVRHWILIPAFPSSSLGSPTTLTNICLLTLKQFIFLRRILICQFQCMIY